jgi:putative membrane protein
MPAGTARFFPPPPDAKILPFRQNGKLKLYCLLFIGSCFYFAASSTHLYYWALENSLTIAAFIALAVFYRYFRFSNLSYFLILLFLMLHMYGSQKGYIDNPFGLWLKEHFSLHRNYYDRLVHFSFGLFLVYPLQEVLFRLLRLRGWPIYVVPLELTLSLSAFYELVEWLVADVFFPDLGIAFIGAQGDIWDSQKDMFLATLGAFISLLFLLLYRRKQQLKR